MVWFGLGIYDIILPRWVGWYLMEDVMFIGICIQEQEEVGKQVSKQVYVYVYVYIARAIKRVGGRYLDTTQT